MAIRFPEVEKYLARLKPIVERELAKEGITPQEIQMRAKHSYSLWRKLEKYHYNWSEINDLVAMRLIVYNIGDCYKTLGILHKLWRPLPGRIKDYIALPKPSGYQSLHTTVFALNGRRTEFQIRTRQMHENAEYGIAAHWRYKNKVGLSQKQVKRKYAWVEQIREWQRDSSHGDDFIESLKLALFGDRIFIFTPKGDVIDLPQGATPVDFAYTIHSNLGAACAAALVNGKMRPLGYELQNGDVVEILKSKNKTPSRQWLSFTKTSAARSHIKRWLREQNREENIAVGISLLNEQLQTLIGKTWNKLSVKEKEMILNEFLIKDENELLVSVGRGDVSAKKITHILLGPVGERPKETKQEHYSKKVSEYKISIAGVSGLQAKIAKCCTPKPPEHIAAYVTIGQGASIHEVSCTNLSRVAVNKKIIPAYWRDVKDTREVRLTIITADRIGMIQDISQAIASM